MFFREASGFCFVVSEPTEEVKIVLTDFICEFAHNKNQSKDLISSKKLNNPIISTPFSL